MRSVRQQTICKLSDNGNGRRTAATSRLHIAEVATYRLATLWTWRNEISIVINPNSTETLCTNTQQYSLCDYKRTLTRMCRTHGIAAVRRSSNVAILYKTTAWSIGNTHYQTSHNLHRSVQHVFHFHPFTWSQTLQNYRQQHGVTRLLLLYGALTWRPKPTMSRSHAPLPRAGQHWISQRQSRAASTAQSSAGLWRRRTSRCRRSTVGEGCRQTEKCRALHERWWHHHDSRSMQVRVQPTCWRRMSAVDLAAGRVLEFLDHPAAAITHHRHQLITNTELLLKMTNVTTSVSKKKTMQKCFSAHFR